MPDAESSRPQTGDWLKGKLDVLARIARDSGVKKLLQDPPTLTWLFECRVHVPQTVDTACLAALVDAGHPQPSVR